MKLIMIISESTGPLKITSVVHTILRLYLNSVLQV